LKQIEKEEFLKMFELKILIGNDKKKRSWTITCRNKHNSKRKKYYVTEPDYREYKKSKNNKKRVDAT
jgi:hypothetical protein